LVNTWTQANEKKINSVLCSDDLNGVSYMQRFNSMIMEDYVETLIYLVVGVVYLLIKNSNSRRVDEQQTVDHPSEHSPRPTSSLGPSSTWVEEAQEAPLAKVPLQKIGMESGSPRPRHSSPIARTVQQPTDKKVGRVLRRYSGWKKAVIMGELIQPHH